MTLKTLVGITETVIIEDIIGIEGGEDDNPDDSGGDTKYGVTTTAANLLKSQLVAQFQWDGTIANLTPAMAVFVYQTNYWNVMDLNAILAIHPLIAHKLFDIGVNMGTTYAGEFLQLALNTLNKQGTWYADIAVDGNIGPGTAAALTNYLNHRGAAMGVWHILVMLISQQGQRYINIATSIHTDETFEDGWIDRIGSEFADYASLLGI